MPRVLKGSHSFTCTSRVHPLTEWTIPAFAFPAEAGTHLPTPEGWKAELALSKSNFKDHYVDVAITQCLGKIAEINEFSANDEMLLVTRQTGRQQV